MRKTSIFLIIIFISLLVYAIMNMAPNGHTVEVMAKKTGATQGLPFKNGEAFTYEVGYQGANIGESVLKFHGEAGVNEKTVYYITFSTRVPSFRDTEEIYADPETFLPVEVRRTIKKTIGFNEKVIEKYDQKNFKVDISSKSKLRSKNFTIEKDSPIHNAILLAYYYRAFDSFSPGDKFNIALPTADFEVTYSGIEKIETPLGEFQAHVFTSEPPKFKLWLSADERRIPLKIKNPGTLGYSLVIKSID